MLHAEVIGMTGRKTLCWCDAQGPQSNGHPASVVAVTVRAGGEAGATNERASRYHSTDEETRTSSLPCLGQNLSRKTASPRKTILASTACRHTRQRPFVMEK